MGKDFYVVILTYLNFRVLAIIGPPRVVATLSDSPMLPSEDQAVGAVVLGRLPVIACPVFVTVLIVPYDTTLGLAWFFYLCAGNDGCACHDR